MGCFALQTAADAALYWELIIHIHLLLQPSICPTRAGFALLHFTPIMCRVVSCLHSYYINFRSFTDVVQYIIIMIIVKTGE
jgi:hypothetical protein